LADEVKTTRTTHTEYTKEIPSIRALLEKHGKTKASRMLGLTDITHLTRAGKARPAYELAAKAILAAETPKDDTRVRSFVVKMSPEHLKILQPLIDTLGVPYLELDF
jgi:hypothetical protein